MNVRTTAARDLPSPTSPQASFAARLYSLKMSNDRAALAMLRRSLADFGRDFTAYAVIGRILPDEVRPHELRTYALAAGLFALHPNATQDRRTFGRALGTLHSRLERGKESLDLLFSAILNTDAEDLPRRLRQVISRLADANIPLDYARLAFDLLNWNHGKRFVQEQWASDYWIDPDRAGADADDEGGDAGEASSEDDD